MTSILLAGGESKRFPFNKSMIVIHGVSLIERILDLHKRIFQKCLISTNSPEIHFKYGVEMIGDLLNERGPMTGIFSSMVHSSDELFFVTACDMPFVSEKLVRYITSIQKEVDAVIPVWNEMPQPLLGVYNRRLIEYLYVNITEDRKNMRFFLNEINAYYIDEEKVKEFDSEGRSFININTLNDLRKIQGGDICLDSESRN